MIESQLVLFNFAAGISLNGALGFGKTGRFWSRHNGLSRHNDFNSMDELWTIQSYACILYAYTQWMSHVATATLGV